MSKDHKHKHQQAEKTEKTAESPAAENADQSSVSQAEYQLLLDKLQALEAVKEQMLRSAADYENAKKRIAKDREEFSKYALEGLFLELLPVLDNFERALSHQGEINDPTVQSVWSGIELIYKQFQDVLKEQGLTKMNVVGKVFDPQWHDAVGSVETDSQEDGLIASEELTGYLLRDKVIRHAKVKVYKSKTPPETEGASG
ncbi:MAG: nucleotide exchange factor GrpE [Candidatus Omnitrophica bacterium CG11_big_fil_rev_8_21_14_0_20_45_26]|uniref:Protein GrpE n=1 Tax=Candidatus Abzuiibacterium crystallinum TaxID=1974748 RepID=A0A2H0LL89_9BACT|nr:MAG: nucleotide exchange factor GrpE [Candidatus Omnitrophica bacterium CG11_big_fil_rev_8_21_14_0_20_45_26]PIW63804.1 MAG: nucleotide exchange factor GrpE [Candidatus Omnitrophica bacterium CG12_big_fil_rev_8_21_14_0_65_45_16]